MIKLVPIAIHLPVKVSSVLSSNLVITDLDAQSALRLKYVLITINKSQPGRRVGTHSIIQCTTSTTRAIIIIHVLLKFTIKYRSYIS